MMKRFEIGELALFTPCELHTNVARKCGTLPHLSPLIGNVCTVEAFDWHPPLWPEKLDYRVLMPDGSPAACMDCCLSKIRDPDQAEDEHGERQVVEEEEARDVVYVQ